MPILSTDRYGAGPLHTFTAADPFALLEADVVYYQTSTAGNAIVMNVAQAMGLRILGSVYSEGVAIAGGTGAASISIADGATVSGGGIAISITGGLTLLNSGVIESTRAIAGFGVINTALATVRSEIINDGLIRGVASANNRTSAINTGGGDDLVTNTGTIIGDIFLGEGNDRIDTHLGDVIGSISGGNGNDTFIIKGTEVISDFGGLNSVISHGDYRMAEGVANLTLVGDATVGLGNNAANVMRANVNRGGNILQGRGGDDLLLGSVGGDLLYGGAGDDDLELGIGDGKAYGGVGNDALGSFNEGVHELHGDAGDDVFQLNAGENRAFGGLGDDTFFVAGFEIDVVDGEEGFDTLSFASTRTAVFVNLTTQVHSGESAVGDTYLNVERIIGSRFDDVIAGSGAADVIDGGLGDDRLFGGNGGDLLIMGLGDFADGGIGSDTASFEAFTSALLIDLTTGTGVVPRVGEARLESIENVIGGTLGDQIVGSRSANRLEGRSGEDSLAGGTGADILIGGLDNDILSGGGQRDTFVFGETAHGDDVIVDFTPGIDTIAFLGNPAIDATLDISLNFDGTDTVLRIAFGSIRLVGIDAADVSGADIVFGNGTRGTADDVFADGDGDAQVASKPWVFGPELAMFAF